MLGMTNTYSPIAKGELQIHPKILWESRYLINWNDYSQLISIVILFL